MFYIHQISETRQSPTSAGEDAGKGSSQPCWDLLEGHLVGPGEFHVHVFPTPGSTPPSKATMGPYKDIPCSTARGAGTGDVTDVGTTQGDTEPCMHP